VLHIPRLQPLASTHHRTTRHTTNDTTRQLPSVKVEQDENPNFRMRPQLVEITYQFLQQYWPLRFDSAAVLAGIREKITQHEVEVPPTRAVRVRVRRVAKERTRRLRWR